MTKRNEKDCIHCKNFAVNIVNYNGMPNAFVPSCALKPLWVGIGDGVYTQQKAYDQLTRHWCSKYKPERE